MLSKEHAVYKFPKVRHPLCKRYKLRLRAETLQKNNVQLGKEQNKLK